MRDKVVDYIMLKIENKNEYDKTKLLEIRYGLQGLYTLVTKSIVIIILAILLDFVKELLLFNLFYIPLRSVGYGTHASSNIQCWIFSILFILGFPYLLIHLNPTLTIQLFLWGLCFICFLLFSPADTEKRPMINKKRKLKFKLAILVLSFIYLFLLLRFESISNLVVSAMLLQSVLVSPLGYIIMGQKVRFRLNDINIFKLN
ncbi:MAG: accessory gene regulator B family protein [Bacilli bacterium]|nr:accessory gene regulator B family protein [Bacilli bacterium]